jgi:hypothetical protein
MALAGARAILAARARGFPHQRSQSFRDFGLLMMIKETVG